LARLPHNAGAKEEKKNDKNGRKFNITATKLVAEQSKIQQSTTAATAAAAAANAPEECPDETE
jgi:hypothetical protein